MCICELDSDESGRSPMAGSCEHSTKGREFIDHLSDGLLWMWSECKHSKFSHPCRCYTTIMSLSLPSNDGGGGYMKGLIIISLPAFELPSYVSQTHVLPPNLFHPAIPYQYSRRGYKITQKEINCRGADRSDYKIRTPLQHPWALTRWLLSNHTTCVTV